MSDSPHAEIIAALEEMKRALTPMRSWNKFDFFDPATGGMAVRYQGFSGHGTYWLSRPAAPGGKSRREQREWVLDLIERAIERGDEPGEVAYEDQPQSIARF